LSSYIRRPHDYYVMEKNIENIIWFSAFYEGEGSISNDINNGNRFRLSISQNDVTPLVLGQSVWGGNIRKRIRKSKNKICYGNEWVLNHIQALKFIEDIRPYMKIPYKIKQIEDAFIKLLQGYKMVHKCYFCEKTYKNASNRRRHEHKNHINKGDNFCCEKCTSTFTQRDTFEMHKKSCGRETITSEVITLRDLQIAETS
jgi:hypothetical protein